MAKRRTRREKIATTIRRVGQDQPRIASTEIKESPSKINPEVKTSFYVPEISLPTKLVVSDLTKSGVVTILALIFQFALANYLNRGGWETVNRMLHEILSKY